MNSTVSLYVGPTNDPDRYALYLRVGSGGEGEVWHGSRILADGTVLEVAIKLPTRDGFLQDVDPREVASTWENQRVRLNHLNESGIVPVQETFLGAPPHPPGAAGSQATTPYFVMRWIDGKPLNEWATKNDSPSDRLVLLVNVAASLDALHREGLVHADIKPGNLIVEEVEVKPATPDAPAKTVSRTVIVDFGLLRAISAQPPGQIAASPGYCAPEVRSSGAYSPASDMYAFGGVVYWLLTGQDPPISTPQGDLAGANAATMRAAGIDERVVHEVAACFASNPAQRPKGASAWLARVRGGVSSSLPGTSPWTDSRPPAPDAVLQEAPLGPPVATDRHRRRRVLTVAAAVIALAALLGAYIVNQASNPRKDEARASDSTTLPSTTIPPPTSTSSTTSSTSTTSTTELTTTTLDPAAAQAETAPAVQRLGASSLSSEDSNDPTILRPVGSGGNSWAYAPNTINGKAFDRVLGMGWCSGCLDSATTSGYSEYNLTRGYKRMTATVGQLDKSTQATGTFRYEVIADGVPVFSTTLPFGKSAPISVDVTGVLRIRLTITLTSAKLSAITGFGDPTVTKT